MQFSLNFYIRVMLIYKNIYIKCPLGIYFENGKYFKTNFIIYILF